MSGPTPTDPMQVRIEGPSPALSVAFDLAKRSLWLAPVIVFGSAAIWGIEGVYSTLYALLIVVANFLLLGLPAGRHRSHQRSTHGRRGAVRLPVASRADLPRRASWSVAPGGSSSYRSA